MGREISRWEEDFNPVQLLGVGDKRWKGGGGRRDKEVGGGLECGPAPRRR